MRAWLPAKTRAYLLCRAPAGVLKLAFSVVFFSFFLTNSAKFITVHEHWSALQPIHISA